MLGLTVSFMMCICFTAWWVLFRNKLLRYCCLYYFLNRKTLESLRYYWPLFCKGLLRASDSNGWAHSRCSYCILFRPWGYRSLVGCFYGFISTFVSSMAAAFGGAVGRHALVFWSCLVGMVGWPWRSGGWGGLGAIFVSTIVPPKFEILLIFPNFLWS